MCNKSYAFLILAATVQWYRDEALLEADCNKLQCKMCKKFVVPFEFFPLFATRSRKLPFYKSYLWVFI